MKQLVKYLLVPASVMLTACGGDSFDLDLDSGNSSVVGTSNYNIYVPEGMDSVPLSDPYFDGFMLGAGDKLASLPQTPGTNKVSSLSQAMVTTYSARDVVAFIAEREAYYSENTGADVLSTIERKLSSMSSGDYANILKQQLDGTNQMLASYLVTATSNTTVTDFATDLLEDIALSSEALGEGLENPPVPAEGEALTQDFEVYVGVFYEPTIAGGFDLQGNLIGDQVVILAAVVPADIAASYSNISKGVTSTTNVGSQASAVVSNSELFTAEAGSDKADFLFVIDNSGSMSDDQDAISTAADAFVNVISTSGLDAKFGTITTDSDVLQDTNQNGAFTSNTVELKQDIKPGSNGSATESGIYFAEKSLLDLTKNDGSNGTVVTEGHPRVGASMSVIFLSDEADQYSSYASQAFDATNNLFVDRNYQVYGILSPYSSENRDNGYVDLINNTNGTYADITNLLAFNRIIEEIALNAGSASSRIQLTETPIRNTIEVTVNGSLVLESTQNGWQYNEGLKTLAFFGAAKPAAGDEIKVSYQHRQGN